MPIQETRSGWRTSLGLTLFIISIAWPLFIPLLPLLGATAKTVAAFSGVMFIVAEVLLIAGAAIAGKDGFAFIKARVFGFLKSYGPPHAVSRRRYRIGLVLFSITLAYAWAAPYFGHHLPGFEDGQLMYAIAGDIVLLLSLLILGGGFWEKLQALFRYDESGAGEMPNAIDEGTTA